MSLWSDLKAAVYKPIRGIGRVARGAVTGDKRLMARGVGDFGSGLKAGGKFAAFIPGVGPGVGAAMTAVGSLAERADDYRGLKTWRPVNDTLLPAAKTYALGRVVKSVGGKIMGGGGAPGVPGMSPVPPTDLAGLTGPLSTATPAMAPGAAGGLGSIGRIARGVGGIASRAGDVAGGIGSWAEKNPELALGLAGTGAEVYGAREMGQQEDEMLAARARAWERIRRNRAAQGMGY